MLSCGLIGLPLVGKTTLYNLLTKSAQETSSFFTGKTEAHKGIAMIPDARIDFLSGIYKPRKTIYAQLEVVDLVGLVKGASEGQGVGNAYLSQARNVDSLVHVVRVFNNPDVPHPEGKIDPLRDIETINLELLFSDLDMVEKRIERIEAGKKKADQAKELSILGRIRDALHNEKTVHSLDLTDEESAYIRSFALFTEKPMILVVNIDEEQLRAKDYPHQEALRQYAGEKSMPLLEICAQAELEISQLEPGDQEEFMLDLGIAESGISLLARSIYHHLKLISFFTVGEDEVRAWTIDEGITARAAAGKIHSDLERGFIRAEVIKYSDLHELGNITRVKEKGLFRLEGKEYIVVDGDIMSIRFNV
ncbi:MAG: redox-regulated ATPase YchF [Firmicutes bacterium]|nr:redox-regulated ATPase YchF [Bacillota bacterium]